MGEIMLMKASPLAVETKVFLQAQVSLLVFQVEEVDRTIYHWTAPKSLPIKKAMEKPQCQLTMPKLLASTKIVSHTVRFRPLEGTSNPDQTRLKITTREMDLIYGNEWTTESR